MDQLARRIPVRKRWGQHFLVDPRTADRIVEAAQILPGEIVVEVGPGDGALTRPLALRAAGLLAIEIDPLRARELAREFTDKRQVRIVPGDALGKSFGEWLSQEGWSGPAVLVANLPYNAATPILTAAIEDPSISRAIATVQREVARRFAARPGDEGYGYLSVRAAASANARILFELPPGAFHPRPRVTSAVLEMSPREPPLPAKERLQAVRLASLGFRWRRKTLANALASVSGRSVWEEALVTIGKSPRARAEELSLEDYLELARCRAAG